MAEYAITLARSARKELERLQPQLVSRIVSKIEALGAQPRPTGCRKLQGEENLWRIRVGSFRVIYAVYDSQMIVDIIAVCHRSDAYR